jgi:hypothetical protein
MNLLIKFKQLLFGKTNIPNKEDNLCCPNCHNDKWIELSGGGSFGNIQCSNCNTKYNNLGIFGLQKLN